MIARYNGAAGMAGLDLRRAAYGHATFACARAAVVAGCGRGALSESEKERAANKCCDARHGGRTDGHGVLPILAGLSGVR